MLIQCQDCFMEFPLADISQTANKVSRWEKTKLPQPAVYSPPKIKAPIIQPKHTMSRSLQTKQNRNMSCVLLGGFLLSDLILT